MCMKYTYVHTGMLRGQEMMSVAFPEDSQFAALWQGFSLNLEKGSWPQSHGDPPVSATHSAGVTDSYAVLLNFLT